MTLLEYKEKLVEFLEENPDCGELQVIEYQYDKWDYVKFRPQEVLMNEYGDIFDEIPRGCLSMPVVKAISL